MIDDSVNPDKDAQKRSIEQLIKLRERLMSKDISIARLGAYNLSWMQEDGMTILKEALYGNYPKNTKRAAAYGLRNMKGRMKKLATEALEAGLNHRDPSTQAICLKSLQLMRGELPPQKPQPRGSRYPRRRIENLPADKNSANRKPYLNPNSKRPFND